MWLLLLVRPQTKLWMARRYQPYHNPVINLCLPGRIVHNSLDTSTTILKGASDGSLYRDESTMAAGWLLAEAEDSEKMAAAVFVVAYPT